MRETHVYSANIKSICLHLHLLRGREIGRISNLDILSFTRIDIL